VHDFKDLKVWIKAHELTVAVYRTTREVPREELFGLTPKCVAQPPRLAPTFLKDVAEDRMVN
jgi:hypothetical protein